MDLGFPESLLLLAAGLYGVYLLYKPSPGNKWEIQPGSTFTYTVNDPWSINPDTPYYFKGSKQPPEYAFRQLLPTLSVVNETISNLDGSMTTTYYVAEWTDPNTKLQYQLLFIWTRAAVFFDVTPHTLKYDGTNINVQQVQQAQFDTAMKYDLGRVCWIEAEGVCTSYFYLGWSPTPDSFCNTSYEAIYTQAAYNECSQSQLKDDFGPDQEFDPGRAQRLAEAAM